MFCSYQPKWLTCTTCANCTICTVYTICIYYTICTVTRSTFSFIHSFTQPTFSIGSSIFFQPAFSLGSSFSPGPLFSSGHFWTQPYQLYSACCLVRPWMEELISEKNSLEKNPKPLKRWMGRPQLLPEIVENVLRSLWWGNGSKQPSPCLQPPKVGGLLRHLLLLLKAPLT